MEVLSNEPLKKLQLIDGDLVWASDALEIRNTFNAVEASSEYQRAHGGEGFGNCHLIMKICRPLNDKRGNAFVLAN